jgi:hypothetical protein
MGPPNANNKRMNKLSTLEICEFFTLAVSDASIYQSLFWLQVEERGQVYSMSPRILGVKLKNSGVAKRMG